MTAEVATIVTIISALVSLVNLWSSRRIKAALAEFELQFLEKLNGRYLRSDVATAKFDAIHDRLEKVEP